MKRIIVMLLACSMMISACGCHDSSTETSEVKVDYDVNDEIAPYLENLKDIPEADKDLVIEMGYNDCDHMVAAIIGERTGLYKALGLNVNVTKTGKVAEAMASGDMVVGYAGFGKIIKTANQGAPIMMPAGSHLGGSRYLVVKPDVEKTSDIIGLKIGCLSEDSIYSPGWLGYCAELNIPVELSNYEAVSMGQSDAMFALKAGTIDAFSCCDPYASIAELEGFGKIIGTEWGAHVSDDLRTGWGLHCGYYINSDFAKAHPELATRLVLAHCLAIKYMYEHPYNAGMMFADGFDCDPSVGLRTIYIKTCAEGRTLCWDINESNIQNYTDYYKSFNIPDEEIPYVTEIASFLDLSYLEACGIEPFADYIEAEGIEETFPIRMSYSDWLYKAEEIDGIDHESTVGKTVDKWMNGEVVTKLAD